MAFALRPFDDEPFPVRDARGAAFTHSGRPLHLAACAGVSLGLATGTDPVQDTEGVWSVFQLGATSPVGSLSALCSSTLLAPFGGPAFDAFFDQLRVADEAEIFSDGFESGDTSAWQ